MSYRLILVAAVAAAQYIFTIYHIDRIDLLWAPAEALVAWLRGDPPCCTGFVEGDADVAAVGWFPSAIEQLNGAADT